ncbi:MAG: transcriptional repressor [Spirochaetaceae bacterium]|jgi:Fur family ferric uptake transcriptional regulator|nr:transcriptional repressor [Spirochaetaceae bacterium]
MTRNRKFLLDILINERLPLNASQIHNKNVGNFDLATVYRGLTYLEKNDYVSSFVFDCHDRGVERYYTVKKEKHEHFMHCENCHKFIVIDYCPMNSSLKEIESDYGFVVDEHILTLKGICRECSKGKNV